MAKETSTSEALAKLDELEPGLLITGIKMTEGEADGVALVRQATERFPNLKAIVLSMYDDRAHIEAAFAAGAYAYVLKSANPDDLHLAIRQAFEPSVYLATNFQSSAVEPVDTSPVDFGLTRRELEILQLVAEGHSNAHLARMLWVTEQTVKFHLSNIYRKLDVANRTEAGRWAQVHGLLTTQVA